VIVAVQRKDGPFPGSARAARGPQVAARLSRVVRMWNPVMRSMSRESHTVYSNTALLTSPLAWRDACGSVERRKLGVILQMIAGAPYSGDNLF